MGTGRRRRCGHCRRSCCRRQQRFAARRVVAQHHGAGDSLSGAGRGASRQRGCCLSHAEEMDQRSPDREVRAKSKTGATTVVCRGDRPVCCPMCNLQHCFVRTPSGSCIIHIQSKESVMVCARALVLCQMLLVHCSRTVCNTKGGGVTIAFWVVFQRIICYVPRIAPAPSSVHNGFLDGRYPGAKAYSHPVTLERERLFGRAGSGHNLYRHL